MYSKSTIREMIEILSELEFEKVLEVHVIHYTTKPKEKEFFQKGAYTKRVLRRIISLLEITPDDANKYFSLALKIATYENCKSLEGIIPATTLAEYLQRETT